MPVWLKAVLPKLEALVNARLTMLEPTPTWQLSQPRLCMGTWLAPGRTMLRVAVLKVLALGSAWHRAQVLAAGKLAWMRASVGCVPQLSWQVLQLVPVA